MKKIVINISDSTYERLRFEAIGQKKSIQKILEERMLHKPFSDSIEKAMSQFIQNEIEKM